MHERTEQRARTTLGDPIERAPNGISFAMQCTRQLRRSRGPAIRQPLITGDCVIRISSVMPAASWSPIVQRPWSGSVTHAELESLGSGKLHGSGPEAGNLQVGSAVVPVDDVENEFRSGCHLDHPGEIGHHLARREQEQRFDVARDGIVQGYGGGVSRLGSDAWFGQDNRLVCRLVQARRRFLSTTQERTTWEPQRIICPRMERPTVRGRGRTGGHRRWVLVGGDCCAAG
jgi:hypothetical protein